jgi:hypothetical protein
MVSQILYKQTSQIDVYSYKEFQQIIILFIPLQEY